MDEAIRTVTSTNAKRVPHVGSHRFTTINLIANHIDSTLEASSLHPTQNRILKPGAGIENPLTPLKLNLYSLHGSLTVLPHIDKSMKSMINLKVGMHRSQEQICKIRMRKRRKNLAFCALRPHIDAVR